MRSLRFGIFFMAVLLSALFQGCEKEGLDGNAGYIVLNISQDKSVEVITKAGEEPVFRIEVMNSEGVIVKSYDNHNELLENPLKLVPGTYTVKGSTGEYGGDAAFGKPFYSGETEVTVEAGKISTAKVVCTLSQVKVTVKCGSDVTDNFKEVMVTVTNQDSFGTKNNLIYSYTDGTMENEGYFACTGVLNYKVYLVNHDNEISDGEIAGTLDNVKAKEHYILNLAMSGEDLGGALVPGIGVDNTTNDKYFNIPVILDKKEKPAFGSEVFDIGGNTYIAQNSAVEYKLDITAKAGLESLVLSHSEPAFTAKGLPESVELLGGAAPASADNLIGVVRTEEGVTVDFTALFKGLEIGGYSFKLEALDRQYQLVTQEFAIEVIPDVETTAIEADAWGRHAFLYGTYNTAQQPAGLRFEYRKNGEQEWIPVTDITVKDKNFNAVVTGLDPRTEYVFRTVSDKEPSNEISFTTLGADQIENMSFDNWYKDGKQWYANSDLSADHYWWDSGNKGANTLSEVNPTSPTDVVAVEGDGKQAAKLESKYVVIAFAAGSIYLGEFGSVSGLGASLNFGRRYYCKPLSLKGYYSYAPKAIDKVKAPYENLKGETDICNIYVVLADWPSGTFQVNTNTGTFIDFENDPNIIAYGSLEDNTNTNGYKPFEIELEYRNNRQPTCCVIVCTASKYGDYFTGGVGSTLLVDEFEFNFDYKK